MKLLKTIGFFLLTPCAVISQSNPSTFDYGGKKNEISIEVTPLIERLAPTTNWSERPINPYFFKYRRLYDGWNIRGQFGGDYQRHGQNHRAFDHRKPDLHDTQYNARLALGAELVSSIKGKFQINYGLESFIKHDIVDIDRVTSTPGRYYGFESIENAIGGGPVLGVRAWFWNRLSIGTEASLMFMYYDEKSRETWISYDYSSKERSDPYIGTIGMRTEFNLPMHVWIGLTI